jgi:hypothetical protein
MNLYRYEVTLKLEGPLLSQASGGRAFGVDTAALRNEHDNAALPGELVRGNLRESWMEFAGVSSAGLERDMIEAWLGPDPDNGVKGKPNWEPDRARLQFALFWVAEGEKGDGLQNRIQKDPVTGAVKTGSLQIIESPIPSGKEVSLAGWIDATLESGSEAQTLGKWLRKGLAYVPAYGALKGVGYGRTLGVEVSEPQQIGKTAPTQPPQVSPDGFGIALTLDRPFCFSQPHAEDSNTFESEQFIPGAAMLGALAWRLKNGSGKFDTQSFPALSKAFDWIRITHAFPGPEGSDTLPVDGLQRPVVVPFSLVVGHASAGSEDKALYDVALRDKPGLIHGSAPAFQIDWKDKDWALLNGACGWDGVEYDLKVRTAIKDGRADESKLFAMRAVVPGKRRWLANVDLGAVDTNVQADVARELAALLQGEGLRMLGKTKATARVEIAEALFGFNQPSVAVNGKDRVVIVLQTPTRLLPGFVGPATNGGDELLQAYRTAWLTLSGQTLVLKHFYARQKLVGGEYLWRRFQGRIPPYKPELLTLAGSVFVFEAESGAEKKLDQWQKNGLELLNDQAIGKDWKSNPYLPANGYGEILVNLKLHWDKDPQAKGGWDDKLD